MIINHQSLRPCKHNRLYADTCIHLLKEKAKERAERPRDVLGYFMNLCKERSKK